MARMLPDSGHYAQPQGLSIAIGLNDRDKGRTYLQRDWLKVGTYYDAVSTDFLGFRFWNVHGSLRHSVDGQLRIA